MPLPNPTSAWKYAKWLLRGAEYVLPAAWAYLSPDLTGDEEAEDPVWMRWVLQWAVTTPSGLTDDYRQVKLDVLNITGGAIDNTWIAADFTSVRANMWNIWSAMSGITAQNHTLKEIRAYRMQFNPADPGPGNRVAGNGLFLPSGAPIYRELVSSSSVATGTVAPPQVSATVTLRTAHPKHWGRVYWPTPYAAGFDTQGRLASAYRTTLADVWHDQTGLMADNGFLACVPVGQAEKQTFHGLLGVTEYVVDDIADVQRRRRHRQTAARTIGV